MNNAHDSLLIADNEKYIQLLVDAVTVHSQLLGLKLHCKKT